MAGVAFVFPGQGAQGAGMLDEELTRAPEARDILACADEKLALPMSRLMTTGPGEALFDTTLAQPALLTVGVIDAWHLRNRKSSQRLSSGIASASSPRWSPRSARFLNSSGAGADPRTIDGYQSGWTRRIEVAHPRRGSSRKTRPWSECASACRCG